MYILLMIIASLALLGGVVLGFSDDAYWLAIGIVSFAVIGGFSKALSLLEEIRDQTIESKELLETIAKANINPSSDSNTTSTTDDDLPDI